ncbi:uncharacterized protein LOC126375589 [Pectinophora gossypiella]|uniref:uncharacterized protein LOC126375589 n=1 Tax=Pectinophora gossypiella TaxID=13191 RepID=UPI00214EBA49|nr:uncharacterized protein LOC126375589 [Pectinophora gossypiella]
MDCKTAFTLLFSISLVYGATISLREDPEWQPQYLNYLTTNATSSSNPSTNDINEEIMDYVPLNPSYLSVVEPQNSFAVGKMIAEFARIAIDMFSKMDLSEQNLKNLMEVLAPLVSVYLGPYSQVIVPLLSGIASVALRSLAPQ